MKHPIETAEEAVTKAKGIVSAGTAVGTAVAGSVAGRVLGGAGDAKNKAAGTAKETADLAKGAVKDPAGTAKETAVKAAGAAKTTTAKASGAAKTTTAKASGAAKTTTGKAKDTAGKAKESASKAKDTAKESAGKASQTAKKAPRKQPAKREPQVVLAEPAPPAEPPIDVVGEALAAEAEQQIGAGRSTEPRAASRDEEHGEAALQRAEAEEIAEELAEAMPGGDLDIDTPVHTTGADVGYNPDTAEADLQQPGTEPLLDPSLTKAVKKEQDTLHQAAEPDKG